MKLEMFLCTGVPKITSLEGIGRDYFQTINGEIYLTDTITSNVLGLLKIKNLTGIQFDDDREIEDLYEVKKIMNKHLKDKDIAKCRQELIEAGLKKFAKL